MTSEPVEPDRSGVYKDDERDWWSFHQEKGGWDYFSSRPAAERYRDLERANGNGRTWAYMLRELPRAATAIAAPVPKVPGPTGVFVVKDSGVREEYANGFVRDTEDGKPDFTRLLAIEGLELVPVEMIERWAAHMVKGAQKYGVDNWRQARGQVPRDRFLRSLLRHVVQYVRGDRDEDHASAIMFNVAARELTPDE